MEDIIYEMTVENSNIEGVFAISLVDSPAIQEDFILLSNDENKTTININLAEFKKEKKLVTGPALIPDIIIPRKGYSITFSKDTIRKISENFLIKGNQEKMTLQHQVPVNGIYLVESWIIEDNKNDKSTALGFDLPVGTWMVSLKVTDDNIWNEFIASKKLLGFSIEGRFSEKEVKMHTHDENCNHLDDDLHDIYLALNFTVADLDKYFMWKLGSVAGKENCPICVKNNGKIHTLRQWLSIGIPRVKNGSNIAGLSTSYQYGDYGTYCEKNCNCELVRVAEEVKRRVINPFKR